MYVTVPCTDIKGPNNYNLISEPNNKIRTTNYHRRWH